MHETTKTRRYGELWVFSKTLTVSLVYDTSWSVFISLGKGLEHFMDKSKAQRAAFPCVLLEYFEKFMFNPYYEPLLWFRINLIK